jgi:hypothetical protein
VRHPVTTKDRTGEVQRAKEENPTHNRSSVASSVTVIEAGKTYGGPWDEALDSQFENYETKGASICYIS